MLRRSIVIFYGCLAMLAGCGNINSDTARVFGLSDNQDKTACPNATAGFYVCLDADSSFLEADFKTTILRAMATLIKLVNESDFQQAITSGLSGGDQVVASLKQTNYIVLLQSYCASGSSVLAQASVGGYTINYNECTVTKDSSGADDNAQVSGVLLHEISHNLGYTHADVNPSPDSVPYFLGNTAEAMLSPSSGATTGTNSVVSRSSIDSQSASPMTFRPRSSQSGRWISLP